MLKKYLKNFEKKIIWLINKLKLSCLSLKYLNYEIIIEYKLYIKKIPYKSCKIPKKLNDITKNILK